MANNGNWKTKKTVLYSLAAPMKLAVRPSGKNKGQAYRTIFMRDRDRILYSKSFRRLAMKTQVFLSSNDVLKRTRLTHTLEVAQIAKTISNNLKLDQDLTEAIALGHDIGHTPFGHAGERTLHEIMTPTRSEDIIDNSPITGTNLGVVAPFCGFKHNLNSVYVALDQEKYDINYGLDLSNFTLYGMKTHSGATYKTGRIADAQMLDYYKQYESKMCFPGTDLPSWSFESFVVAEADEIAQRHHDLEDAIRGNLITKEELTKKIHELFFHDMSKTDRQVFREMQKAIDLELYVSLLSKLIVNMFVTQITECSIYNMNRFITENKLNAMTFAKRMPEFPLDVVKKIVAYDKNDAIPEGRFKGKMDTLGKFISEKVISSFDIQSADAHGKYVIEKIFKAYFKTPTQLPDQCVIDYLTRKDNDQKKIHEEIKIKGIGSLRSRFSKEDFSDIDNGIILMRVICDYISSMTDAETQKTFEQLYM